MEKPEPTLRSSHGPAAASGQPGRAVPQLWTCSGYKRLPHIPPYEPATSYLVTLFTYSVCACSFLFTADHVSHLENVSEDEINRLLGMVVDVENLFMSVHKEEDTDTKQVYFYLFKVSNV